jgi:hypothetical protein
MLIDLHKLSGLKAFSRQSFHKMFRVPGFMAYRAVVDDQVVGMSLWYRQSDAAYYHLSATDEKGYECNVTYSMLSHILADLSSSGVRWACLGAGAGIRDDDQSGLGGFKAKWATDTRDVYFCGRIFDREKYDQLARMHASGDTNYFPSYRAGELM